MAAYYNENSNEAADYLESLVCRGLIASGDVDRRPIQQVGADDLRKYGQCHFFAGIGGWSLALRLAGWPDDRPVWTGSCPCQPFSALGERKGFGDSRHLWPVWFPLIRERRPATIFGEQVARALFWLDNAFSDLENIDYACAAADLPAACVGAPHNRPRLWFIAHAASGGRSSGGGLRQDGAQQNRHQPSDRDWWNVEPAMARVADGIPGAVAQRRALGNAIVPQVAAEFIAAAQAIISTREH